MNVSVFHAVFGMKFCGPPSVLPKQESSTISKEAPIVSKKFPNTTRQDRIYPHPLGDQHSDQGLRPWSLGISQKGSPERFRFRLFPFSSDFFLFLPFFVRFHFFLCRFFFVFFLFSVFFRFIFRKKRGDTVHETPFANPESQTMVRTSFPGFFSRDDNKSKRAFLRGVGCKGREENCPQTLFLVGNAATINFESANFMVETLLSMRRLLLSLLERQRLD